MLHNIEILSSADVNRTRWDECIGRNENGLIYSTSDYLDHLSDNWDAIVIGDYETVMPIPWRKKLGVRYFYTPPFIQQLGLIGNTTTGPSELYTAISGFARYGDIHFNYKNEWAKEVFRLQPKTNLVLDLSRPYDVIASLYRKDLSANLRKAAKDSFNILITDDIALAVTSFRANYQERLGRITKNDYNKFEELCHQLLKLKKCFVRQVVDARDRLLSVGLFLTDNKRIYNLMNTTTTEGRNKEANHLLLDSVIKEFAGRQLLFDFEGSDIPGVKSFYEKFGAINQPFFHYHHNNLPALLRLLKK